MNFDGRTYQPNQDLFWFGNNSNHHNGNRPENFWRGNDAYRYNGGNNNNHANNNNSNNNNRPQCFICKRRNHHFRDCYYNKNNRKKRLNNNNNNNNNNLNQKNLTNKTQATATANIIEKVENLNISDCGCPICLEILVEPVILPCKHELCLPCFKGITGQNNYTCPMCRVNFSSWAHDAKKQNLLVDKTRWKAIQQTFGTEIRNRVEGKTALLLQDELRNASKSSHQIVAANGEIKKEFEELVKREEERLRLEKEKEEQLSLQYIQEIIQREEACTFSQYINVLKAKEPTTTTRTVPIVKNEQLPTTSAAALATAVILNIAPSRPTAHNTTPLIAVENQQQPTTSVGAEIQNQPLANNRLVKRVKKNNISSVVGTTSADTESQNITHGYSLRSGTKRKVNEVQAQTATSVVDIQTAVPKRSTRNR